MYFVPNSASLLARYDTTASVSAGASWATFELKGVSSSVYGYNGAIFDGRYMYLVPFATSVVMRFDARSPTGAPPFGGSFF
jgi:hypothetical protein